MRKLVRGVVLSASFLAASTGAFAQDRDRNRIDLASVSVAVVGQLADRFTTDRFLVNGSGCAERNARYTSAPFTPFAPDTAKMWRDKAIVVGGVVALQLLTERSSNKYVRAVGRGVAYGAGVRAGASAVRNVKLCGW